VRRLALAVLLAGAASPAAADVTGFGGGPSPRWGSFQLSFSTFQPNIDSEFTNGQAPYTTVFGTSRPLLTQILFTRSLWMTEVGSLDVGLGIGYWQASGAGIAVVNGVTLYGGSTSLLILPVQIAVGYRFDVFFEKWGVPLAPYVRAGILSDIWWANGQGGTSVWVSPTGQSFRGQGVTWGWSGTVGLALVLDFFDETMARQMDFDTGINHTMVFFDFTKEGVDNFGSKKSWQLAPNYWMWSAGILFVF